MGEVWRGKGEGKVMRGKVWRGKGSYIKGRGKSRIIMTGNKISGHIQGSQGIRQWSIN